MKLCYKDYSVKMSLGAIKQFKQNTSLDLWGLLLSFASVFEESKQDTTLNRLRKLYEICDFETASYAFKALIVDDGVSLVEIQDAMFRVGWLPNDREDDMSDPYPLVMVAAVYEIDKQFSDMPENTKKKADTSEQ